MNEEQAKENGLSITQEEICNIKHFNLELLKEAMRQAELRINDENSRKERIDSRAYTLLTFLMGAITLIFATIEMKNIQISIALGLSGIILTIPVILLFLILKSRKYAPLGISPSAWLVREFVESKGNKNDNQDMLGYTLTHVLYKVNSFIQVSDKSNNQRVYLLDKALLFTILSILPVMGAIAKNILDTIVSRFF